MVAIRLTAIAAVILVSVLLAGCTSGDFCVVEHPNRDPVAQMTPREARTALAHNLKGEMLCGWKP